MKGDRLGGVVFDIQKYREANPVREEKAVSPPVREKLIAIASEVLAAIEKLDEAYLREPEQASLSTSLAVLTIVCERSNHHDGFGLPIERRLQCTPPTEKPNPRIEPLSVHTGLAESLVLPYQNGDGGIQELKDRIADAFGKQAKALLQLAVKATCPVCSYVFKVKP